MAQSLDLVPPSTFQPRRYGIRLVNCYVEDDL